MLGCPIRKSLDQCLLTAPQSLSQSSTSFIASYSLGIHHLLLIVYLIILTSYFTEVKYDNIFLYSNLHHFLVKHKLQYLFQDIVIYTLQGCKIVFTFFDNQQ
jgi:hypothetical protein